VRPRAYQAYRASGIAWLGDIPEHWQLKRLGHTVRFRGGATPDKGNSEYWDGTIPWVSPKDMKRPIIGDAEDHVSIDALQNTALSLLPVPSVLVVVRGMILAHSFPVARTSAPVTINQDMKALLCFKTVRPQFLAWALAGLARVLVSMADESAHGTRKLESEILSKLRLAVPPHDEQDAIVAFLDAQTAKIDKLVQKKQLLIERLKEKRAALISRTVTLGLPEDAAGASGLGPGPKLKSSGIEWIGDVRANWDVKKIKYLARVESGHTPARSVEKYWIDCNVPWVSLNDSSYLRTHDVIRDTAIEISELGMANSSAHLLPSDAVVFSRDATVGLCAITARPMAVSQHFVAYLCGPRLLSSYLLLCLKAMSPHLESLSLGATIPTIGMDDVRALTCPVPPVREQEAIVRYVGRETLLLDRLLAHVESAIGRLGEYRVALITAAVTGKIDVRGGAVEQAL
jgi:type I restriction enzyme S subunit